MRSSKVAAALNASSWFISLSCSRLEILLRRTKRSQLILSATALGPRRVDGERQQDADYDQDSFGKQSTAR